MPRQARSSRKRAPRGGRKRAQARAAPLPHAVSSDLLELIRALARGARGQRPLTLKKVRDALQHEGVTWSREGELLFPQDRTALMMELDELIETHGMKARAKDFLAGART
jgi:hypothetical protein